jgi:hypothetical protein
MGGLAMPRLSLDACVSPSPDVVSREVGGELILLDLESATYFGLNEVGSRIWALLAQADSLRGVCDAIEREYAAPRERLEHDLLDLVTTLRRKGLVQIAGRSG